MRRRGVRGFSLLDTLAALGVFALAAAGMSSVTVLHHRIEREASCRVQAVWLAQSAYDYFRTHPQTLNAIAPETALPAELNPASHLPGGSWLIERHPWTGEPRYIKEILITVLWQGPGAGQVTLQGLIGGGGE